MLRSTRVNCTTGLILPPSTLGSTTAFDINTAGGLVASSFSSPPTITQGTEAEDSSELTATEKITKLKQQWLELLP